jgi:hypothetical protein
MFKKPKKQSQIRVESEKSRNGVRPIASSLTELFLLLLLGIVILAFAKTILK